MPEPIDLTPYLVGGLRPYSDIPRGAPYCTKFQQLMASERRAKAMPTATWPSTAPGGWFDAHTAWPYAEVFNDDRVCLGVANNTFYSCNPDTLAKTDITLYDATTPASAYSVSGSGPWHFAAFMDAWFATNGTSLVYSAPSTDSNKTVGYHGAALAVQSVANWGNRLVFGGLSGTRLSSTSFAAIVALWKSRDKRNVITSEDDSFDTTWLLIGPPVGGDSAIPNASLLALLGLPSDTAYTTVFEPQVRSWVEQGLVDLLPLRHTGAIKAMAVHGSDLVVWGAEGTSRVAMSEAGPVEVREAPVGIWGRAAFGGSPAELLFLGKNGEAYMVGSGAQRYARSGVYQPEPVGPTTFRLGWSEFLGTLTAGDSTYVPFDPLTNRYWFACATDSYLLTTTGLSRNLGAFWASCIRVAGQSALLAYGTTKNHLTNGTFTGAATGWTLGAGWVYGTNNVAATTASSSLSQAVSAMARALKSGVAYALKLTVTRSAGSLAVTLGATAHTTTISASGTYQFRWDFDGNSAGLVITGTGFSGTIDDVSLVPAVDIETVPFDGGRRDPYVVERVDLSTTDTVTEEAARWQVRCKSKLQKHLALTTFDWVTADIRGVASVEQSGVEHAINMQAADDTAVDLDAAVAYVDFQKTPSLRQWLTKSGL